MKHPILAFILLLLLLPGCITAGNSYKKGILKNEVSILGPFYFKRDTTHVSYSIIYDNLITCGSSFAGNQYVDILFGGIVMVNIPGLSWIFYPFQFGDAVFDSNTCEIFGIDSGYGDLRISLLWGFLSIGRNWNIVWFNGLWHPGNDPLYHEKEQAQEAGTQESKSE